MNTPHQPSWGAPPRASFVRTGAAILAASVMVALGGTAATAADGTVSGSVFRDFNSNGSFDTGNGVGSGLPNDVALGGVTVTAFDRSGAQVGQTATASDGTYSLGVTATQTPQVRVEFTFSAAQEAEGYESSYHGAGSGTSVQFVQVGATDVNFGANVPEDFSNGGTDVAITAQRPGDPLASGYPVGFTSKGDLFSSVVTVPYEQDSDDSTVPSVEASVDGDDNHGIATGALYGIAAPRSSDTYYASAVLRRHTGLGAAGLGAIYAIDSVTHEASLLVDLDDGVAGGIDVGEASFSAALGSSGSATDNAARGLTADAASPSYDPVAWDNAGKIGLGGLTSSSDGTHLYAINLNSRTLVVIDVATQSATEVALDSLSGDDRPFAVAVHRGIVYVGVVGSAESTGGRADLSMRVISTPESAVLAPSWATALSVGDLTFARGAASDGAFGTPDWTLDDKATHWNAWTEDWSAATSSLHASGVYWNSNSQPLLSTLTFDTNGTMVLGVLDRYTYQTGMVNFSNDSATPDTQRYSGIAAGGVYGASPNGDGTFTFEDNGSLAGVAGGGVANGAGPGGGQYYYSKANAHTNAFTGGVAAAPGFSTLLSTGYDLTGGWTSDAGWLPTTGAQWSLAQRIINNAADNNSPDTVVPGTGKAGGLGGVTVLAALAPVEIGNRTWYDADLDGVQDADEPALPNVTVSLTDANGNPVSDANGNPVTSTTTDADGNYYFSNLVPNVSYIVVFDYSTADVSGLTNTFGITSSSQLSFTVQETVDSSTGSNPDPATGKAPVDVGSAGQNNHTIDAGFIAHGYLAVTKVVTGNAPQGKSFTVQLSCVDFRAEQLDLVELTIKAGQTQTQELPAGASCLVVETDNGSALKTTYAVDSGDNGAAPPLVKVTGSSEIPTGVTITNTFGDIPPTEPPVTPPTEPPVTPPTVPPVTPPTVPPVVTPPTQQPPGLANTGAVSGTWTVPIGGSILLLGIVLVVVRRRAWVRG
ncbi:MAG: SdrD B-like domain-containing protein [Rhodoglobus sp.]